MKYAWKVLACTLQAPWSKEDQVTFVEDSLKKLLIYTQFIAAIGVVLVALLLTLNIFHTFVLVFLLLTLNM